MKTKIIKFLNWCGLFTIHQYNVVLQKERDLKKESTELKKRNNTSKIYLDEIRKNYDALPFQFDSLISRYTKEQINAFCYKLINHARNNSELRDLLSIWKNRIENAEKTLNESNGDQ